MKTKIKTEKSSEVYMRYVNHLGKKHRRLAKNRNFLNNQNYVISELWKYDYFKTYLKNRGNFTLYNIVLAIGCGLIYLLNFIWILIVLIFVLIVIFFRFIYKNINKFSDNKLTIYIYEKFNKKEEIVHYIFRKKIWWNSKKYLFSLKK